MRDEKLALQANERDNVATVFEEGVTAGTQVVVADAAGNRTVGHGGGGARRVDVAFILNVALNAQEAGHWRLGGRP